MQRFAEEIKRPLWRKMKVIYDKYTGGSEFITVDRLEAVVKQVLLEQSPSEINYVIKNIGRIDTDNSGTISFEQFANFILKRHCGEMSLQKMHRNGQIKHSNQHKITQAEFKKLLNLAYAFLSIQVDESVIPEIFSTVDKDHDGLITYPEYFSFTDLYVLETKPLQQRRKQVETIKFSVTKVQQTQQPVKQFRSRFRNFLISELKRIFTLYDRDSNNLLDANELKLLLTEVFGINPQDIRKISTNYFKSDTQGKYQSFNIFVSNFLRYVSQMGWFGMSQLLPENKQSLTLEEFLKLLDLTFSKLNIGRVDKTILKNFFNKLDSNHDGLVEIEDFKSWIQKFLSPLSYFGGIDSKYYFKQDDQSLPYGSHMIKELSSFTHLMPTIRIEMSPARSVDSMERSLNIRNVHHELKFQTRSARRPVSSSRISQSQYSIQSGRSMRSNRQLVARFTFNSQDLAKRVRKQMMYLLEKLDKNRNKQFEESEIISALEILMKSNKTEVLYVIANVFRYDRNQDNIVTYQELANFFLEIHCGQLAIQRLHKEDAYERGALRMMNCKQFVRTVQYALSFIEIDPLAGELEALFHDIDQNKDGWISYQEYFQFLIHYFGTQSQVAAGEKRSRRKTVYAYSTNQLDTPPQERFAKLIRSQMRVLVISYDKNQNLKIQKDQAIKIADEVLNQSQEEINSMINLVFNKKQQNFQYDEIVNKFLETHSSETILVRLYKQGLLRHAQDKMLDLQDFIVITNTAFKYLPVLPNRQHYIDIFSKISTLGNDLVTFKQYQHFVAKYLGKCDSRSFNTVFETRVQPIQKSINLKGSKDRVLIQGIAASLRQHYNTVQKTGQGMNKSLFEQYIISLFGIDKRRDIDYLVWSVFRVDQNSDGKVVFQQCAPFLFKVKAQLGLNDLHKDNPSLNDKQRINGDEFVALIKKSFPFFDFKETLGSSFERLDTDRDGYISDREYLTWILLISRSIA